MAATLFKDSIPLKDSVLNLLADSVNVAQFVSFGPDGRQRHARINGYEIDRQFDSIAQAAVALLRTSGSVNVRSFEPASSKSREFIYGLANPETIAQQVTRLAKEGLFTIVNETVDVNDGGVSGVVLGKLIEFSPRDTPRCVEKPGILSVDRNLGLRLLETVYGFSPDLARYELSNRIEFSIHPLRRGNRQEHTIIWEMEDVGEVQSTAEITWPNNFSRLIGDKAFGLLLADGVNLPVPRTTVFPRALAPFTFGKRTGSGEVWIRTCPVEPEPGLFTTKRGWLDPFILMNNEDATDSKIASVAAQDGIDAAYSGSLIVDQHGNPVIEGVAGQGDVFMLGAAKLELPGPVRTAVKSIYNRASEIFGPVRFEWVYDGAAVWIVQLHKGATASIGNTIYPGEATYFHRFDVKRGIEELRKLIARTSVAEGIVLVGNVGIGSHLGDLLRKARIPSRIEY